MRVVLGDGDLALGGKVLAGVELGDGELEMRLGHHQFARRAFVGAVGARLADDVGDAVRAAAQIVARAAAAQERDRVERRESPHSALFPRSRDSFTASWPKSRAFLPNSMAS